MATIRQSSGLRHLLRWGKPDALGGQGDGYGGATAGGTVDVQRAAVQPDELPGERQAETGALVAPCERRIDLAEWCKRLGQVLRPHADPGVAHPEAEATLQVTVG